jgi:hypothetical protein
MSSADAIDDLDPVNYLDSTMNADVVLRELGFRFEGTSSLGRDHWLKPAGRGIWHSVIVDKDNPNVNYRQVRVKGRGVLDKEFQVIRHLDVPVSEVRRVMLKWINPGTVAEALEIVHILLDADPDAFDPRADLDRLMPQRCPECGSSNVSTEADDEGLIDCFNCGIWFDPLHPNNSPSVPGNYPQPPRQYESLDDEINDLKAYAMQHGMPPRITITFSRTTPESAEQGDFSESGWIDEEGVDMAPDEFDREEGLTATDKAAKYLYDEGATEASSSQFHPGLWYSSGWSTVNYRTGEEEERNFHLVGFTEEQEREVYDKLRQRRHR